MRNGVQLIAYADRFGASGVAGVDALVEGLFSGAFTGVHLLPFYTPYDGADAGFDPTDHAEIDPRLGTWGDVAALARRYDVTADVIVNYISSESPEFIDFVEHGDSSRYADLFLDVESVFPGGPTEAAEEAIYRPRRTSPFTAFVIAGTERLLWTTFSDRPVDINVASESGSAYLDQILNQLAAVGIAQIRLDAVGYAVKTRGTSRYMTPETFAFIDDISRRIHERGMEVLVETHGHFETQLAVAARVDRVYDFALPPLVLHTLYTGSTATLRRWLSIAPRNAITVLDTHDGIGTFDVGPEGDRPGLLAEFEIDALVGRIHRCTNGESVQATGAGASSLDLSRVNSTFFSALDRDHDAYLIARLIQFMSPGIPQVYYAGLLAAANDMELLERTGVGPDINRPFYEIADVERELDRPCVSRLVELCRLRSTHPAFNGKFSLADCPDHLLEMAWTDGDERVACAIDLRSMTFDLSATGRRSIPV